jgi:hypothetical protein
MPALAKGCHGTRGAPGTSKLAASANSTSDRDIVAVRRQAVSIATTPFRHCRPSLWWDGISTHSAQILVSSSG